MPAYREVTRRAAESGVIINVGVGNSQRDWEDWAKDVSLPEGAAFNFLGMSDHVIAVAATDDNPPAGSTIARISSHGTDRYHPTIATSGSREGHSSLQTSFASPRVARLSLQLLRDNPALGFEDIKRILQSTAHPNTAPVTAIGAGVLDPDKARGIAAEMQ